MVKEWETVMVAVKSNHRYLQSGKLIITGAKTYQQITDAYHFINDVFKNYSEVKREITFLLEEEKQQKQKNKGSIQEDEEEQSNNQQSKQSMKFNLLKTQK